MLRILTGILTIFLFSMLLTGCSEQKSGSKDISKNISIVLYSEIDADFTESLASEYSKTHKTAVKTIYEYKEDMPKPDLILAEHERLVELKDKKLIQPYICSAGDRLPVEFKDEEDYWFGAFYDPVVFLINQKYAREMGQENLSGWSNLENTENIRIAIENLSNTKSTQTFIASLASKMGETTAINYLWNISRNVEQYAKFPFTSIRMTAVGDADIAITRQSYVFKYLESDFPAYTVIPYEGTPVNLYGVAIFTDTDKKDTCVEFSDWLIADDAPKRIAQEKNTGLQFLLPFGIDGASVNPDKIWINTKYFDIEKKQALINRWLESVRFSK